MITFKTFLTEGGWSKVETQGTRLTPAVAKKAIALLWTKFERDFNTFLKKKGYQTILIGKPVGSSAYIDRDLEDNPDKEYGDIDVLMVVPRIEGMSEAKNNSMYTAAVKEFVGGLPPAYVLQDKDNFGNAVILKVGDDQFVQVDLVKVFDEHYDWALNRMTPERGLKGALLGNLYTSFGELLHIGIGPNGVFAKEKGGEIVPTKTLKPDSVYTISLDIGEFAMDIVKFVHDRQAAGKLRVSPVLRGLNPDSIKAADLAAVIKGVGETFRANDMFGKGLLKGVADYDEYIKKIKAIYIAKNAKGAIDSKFNKASTPEAKKRAEETKDLLLNKSKQIAALLD